MRIAIRADASVQIGIGHIRRCLTLADELAARGAVIVFVSRTLGIDSRGTIEAAGHRVIELPPPAAPFPSGDGLPGHAAWAEVSWEQDAAETCAALADFAPQVLAVDHYAFDARWHDRVRAGLGTRLVAIDDLGDRALAVEIIVDHNFSADHAAKHAASSAYRPRILGGPTFALLSAVYRSRSDFAVRDTVASVGIFMGGSDVANSTEVAWRAVRSALGPAVEVELVSTRANPHLATLEGIAETDAQARLSLDLPDLAGFFAAHDLQIGAGGGATWERCCIGAPTIAVAFAANHVPVLGPLDTAGILCFSTAGAHDADALASDIATLAADRTRRAALSAHSRALVDGFGAARVAEAVFSLGQD